MKQNDYQDILHPYIRLFLCSFFACMAATLKVAHTLKLNLSTVSDATEKTKLLLANEYLVLLIMYFCILIVCAIVLHDRYYKFKKDNPVFLLSLGYNPKDTPPYHVRFGECLWVVSTIFSIALIPTIVLLDLIYQIFPFPNHMPLSQLTLLTITSMPSAVALIILCLNKKFIQLHSEKTARSDKKTLLGVLVIYVILYLYIIFAMSSWLI